MFLALLLQNLSQQIRKIFIDLMFFGEALNIRLNNLNFKIVNINIDNRMNYYSKENI